MYYNAAVNLIKAHVEAHADFTDEFIEEHASFPHGVNDDLVDSMTQFLNRYKLYGAEYREDNRTQFEKDLEKYKNKMLKGYSKPRKSYY